MAEKIHSRPTAWRTVLIVCRKCGKKLDGGYGRKQQESLGTVLRQSARAAGHRRDVRVCDTGCLGLCPKGAVTALNASRPGTVHAIPAGTDGTKALGQLLGGDVVADAAGIEAA